MSLIQVAWNIQDKKTREREVRALVAAMDELKLNRGLILTQEEGMEISIDDKVIEVKPTYTWLLESEATA